MSDDDDDIIIIRRGQRGNIQLSRSLVTDEEAGCLAEISNAADRELSSLEAFALAHIMAKASRRP